MVAFWVLRRVAIVASFWMPWVANSASDTAEAGKPLALSTDKVVLPWAVGVFVKQGLFAVVACTHSSFAKANAQPWMFGRRVVLAVCTSVDP